MPLETWFPTVVFYEDLQVEPAVRQAVLEAVRERVDPGTVEVQGYVTANNAANDLHLDPRLGPLFEVFRPSLARFFFELMLFDPLRVEFHVGRCWPVVQIDNDYTGIVHHHVGAVFAGVFYLQAPAGSGALEFYKPVESPYDPLPRTGSSVLTYRNASYPTVENRLIVFSADLKHRRLANARPAGDTAAAGVERIAISFDLYTTADLGAYNAGPPRAEFLKRVV